MIGGILFQFEFKVAANGTKNNIQGFREWLPCQKATKYERNPRPRQWSWIITSDTSF